MRAHNETLREQLEAERQAHAEARRLLAAALERIPPAIDATREARQSPETVESPGPGKALYRRGEGAGGRTASVVVAEDVRSMSEGLRRG
jgi:hypothetical protein